MSPIHASLSKFLTQNLDFLYLQNDGQQRGGGVTGWGEYRRGPSVAGSGTGKRGSGANANPFPRIEYLFSPSSVTMKAVLSPNDVRG